MIRLEGCALALDWSVQARRKHEDQPSGDRYVILRQRDAVLFAVADGSGSGAKAAAAAQACLSKLAETEGPLDAAFRACHERLLGGRGAALAILAIEPDSGEMCWAAVGDVDARLAGEEQGRQASVVQIAGTLGISFHHVAPQRHRLRAGDTLVVTTDGVSRDLSLPAGARRSADSVAGSILRDYGRAGDDSLVLAIRVVAAA